jgi:hypothetical protein
MTWQSLHDIIQSMFTEGELMAFTQVDKINRGALFKNDRKTSETHSDYRGEANISGQEFWVDAWIKQSKAGAKYMSMSFKPKTAASPKNNNANVDDEMIF